MRHVSSDGDTATLPSLPALPETARPFWLSAFHGPASPRCLRIDGTLRIGRGPSTGLRVDDGAASREHVELRAGREGIWVTDLESHNGTFLDGRRTRQALVTDAATMRVGESLFRLGRPTEPWSPCGEGALVGGALAKVRRKVALVAPTPLAVLILGETGTGKEVVARALHAASGRSGPFVAVNCAALPEPLVEAELFGHQKGAFTGAAQARRGLFGAATGGTLFLDEVGELPAAVQAKLLRVLEDGEVRPVGSSTSQLVDVRIVSATNRDLAAQVERGQFRADLVARLAGVTVHLPPLRERPEDLPDLAAFLLARAGYPDHQLDTDALEALAIYGWPMNLRELDSVLSTLALSLGDSGGERRIAFIDLPKHIRIALALARGDAPPPRSITAEEEGRTQRERLEDALTRTAGNVRRASRELGVSRAHLYRLMKRYEIEPMSFREVR